MGDNPGKLPLKVRVMMIEAPCDKIGVILVHCKNNGLAELVATLHCQAILHQVF
ncbi:hypothetical protein D3C76_1649150 [compost metagenome]